MADKISIRPYGEYSGNGRANAMQVEVGDLCLWFSYRTVVAFSAPGTGIVVRQNDWKGTTGKHLNWIDGGNKKSRLASQDFEKKLSEMLKKHNLEV